MLVHARLILALSALALAGCETRSNSGGPAASGSAASGSSAPTTPSAPWVSFKSEVGRFAISFPIAPTHKELMPPSGIAQQRFLAALHDDQLVYSVYYADGKPVGEVSETLKKAQDTMVQSQGGALLSEEPIRLGEWHGREFAFSFSNKRARGVMRVRYFVIDQRIYTIIVAGPARLLDAGDIERFFRSFSLLQKM